MIWRTGTKFCVLFNQPACSNYSLTSSSLHSLFWKGKLERLMLKLTVEQKQFSSNCNFIKIINRPGQIAYPIPVRDAKPLRCALFFGHGHSPFNEAKKNWISKFSVKLVNIEKVKMRSKYCHECQHTCKIFHIWWRQK